MATDIYLAESIIHFSGQLSTGIGLAIPLHGEKKVHRNTKILRYLKTARRFH